MPQNQSTSTKTKNISRGRMTGSQRIVQGDTLFDRVRKDKAAERAERFAARPKRITRQEHVALARTIFLEKVSNCGETRRNAGLDMLTFFETAQAVTENGRRISATSIAMRTARKNFSDEVRSDPTLKKAAQRGIELAFESLAEANDRLNSH